MGVSSQRGRPERRVSAQEHGPGVGPAGGTRPRGDHAAAHCPEWTHAAVQGDWSFLYGDVIVSSLEYSGGSVHGYILGDP